MIMNTLMTAERLFSLVFTREESYNAAVIMPMDVVEAESRYLVPVVGSALYEAMLGGGYAELVDEYVAPMVAAWVRYVVEPHLASRCCMCHSERDITEAVNENSERVMRALRERAVVLTRRLSDYLNAHSVDYEEYNREDNPLNRCFIYGDIVQVY